MPYEDVLRFIEQQLQELQSPGEAEAAVQSGVPIARYVAGMINPDELAGELTALGYKGLKRTRLMLAAQLKRELELFNDRLAIKRKQLADKQITLSAFTTWLEESGIDSEGVALEVSRAEAAGPAKVVESVQITLRLLQVQEVAARPEEQAIAVGLRVTQAELVEAPVEGIQPLNVSMSIIQLEGEITTPPLEPVSISLSLVGIEEV